MLDTAPAEICPHCQKPLKADAKIGYRHARVQHLVGHALQAALRLTLNDVADRSFWDAAEECEEDTWDEAACAAHDQILYVIDDIGGMTESQQDKAEQRALQWLKKHYPKT
jgi:hypothetical protein